MLGLWAKYQLDNDIVETKRAILEEGRAERPVIERGGINSELKHVSTVARKPTKIHLLTI